MLNLKTTFENALPLTPRFLVTILKSLCNKIIVERSVLDEIALSPSESDITSLLGVNEVIEIARCIKSNGTVLIKEDTDPTLVGGILIPLSTWTLLNEGTDVSIAIAWVDRSGSSVVYHRLEMYVDYSVNKVILADAFYKVL